MTEEVENVVIDDIASEKPDAVVILEERKPEEEKNEIVESKAKDAASEGVEALAKNLEKANKAAEEANAARILAENRAVEAESKATAAASKVTTQQQQNIDANRAAATNAKAAAQAELDKNKKLAADLMAEGKFDDAEDARLAAFEAKQAIKHADDYLVKLDKAVENISKQEQTKPTSDALGVVDPVTGIKFSPKTYEYVKAQGDSWKDPDFRTACDAAHKAATRKGIKADTDEWAEFMDNKLVALGFKEAPEQEEEVTQEEVKPKLSVVKKSAGASVSPSPSKAVAGSPGVAKKGVKLTGAERDVAQSIVDSLPELFAGENPDVLYAKNKQEGLIEYGEDWLRTPSN